jgi:hypothetical protein
LPLSTAAEVELLLDEDEPGEAVGQVDGVAPGFVRSARAAAGPGLAVEEQGVEAEPEEVEVVLAAELPRGSAAGRI